MSKLRFVQITLMGLSGLLLTACPGSFKAADQGNNTIAPNVVTTDKPSLPGTTPEEHKISPDDKRRFMKPGDFASDGIQVGCVESLTQAARQKDHLMLVSGSALHYQLSFVCTGETDKNTTKLPLLEETIDVVDLKLGQTKTEKLQGKSWIFSCQLDSSVPEHLRMPVGSTLFFWRDDEASTTTAQKSRVASHAVVLRCN